MDPMALWILTDGLGGMDGHTSDVVTPNNAYLLTYLPCQSVQLTNAFCSSSLSALVLYPLGCSLFPLPFCLDLSLRPSHLGPSSCSLFSLSPSFSPFFIFSVVCNPLINDTHEYLRVFSAPCPCHAMPSMPSSSTTASTRPLQDWYVFDGFALFRLLSTWTGRTWNMELRGRK